MKSYRNKFVILLILALFAFTTITAGWGYYLAQPGPLKESARVVIKPGKSLFWIAERLDRAQVIPGARRFKLAVRLMGLQSTLQAGEYIFEPGISMRTVINKIATGDTVQHSITFREGLTVKQVEELLLANPNFTGDVIDLPEGYAYPDTYAYSYGEDRALFLERLKKRAEYELNDAWENRAPDLPLKTPHDLLTLASIVEREAGLDEERALIAGVYINRLNQDMKLQADPTVIYGATNYNGNITTRHLREDQPYNTYVHKGLPPGPIANPGRESLQATANPVVTGYLFFVARGDGGHYFSRTYAEHLKKVEEYVKRTREQNK